MDDEQYEPPEPEDAQRWYQVVGGATAVVMGIVALLFFYAEFNHQIPRECDGFLCMYTRSPREAMWLGFIVGCGFVGAGLWQIACALLGRSGERGE